MDNIKIQCLIDDIQEAQEDYSSLQEQVDSAEYYLSVLNYELELAMREED